jgi:hypothetical protein
MIMIACHIAIVSLTVFMFLGTLKIKSNKTIRKHALSSNRNLDFPDDFDFWN